MVRELVSLIVFCPLLFIFSLSLSFTLSLNSIQGLYWHGKHVTIAKASERDIKQK
jgi:hypothetical protein